MSNAAEGEWVQRSEGLASLQMALEYMNSVSNQFDVLDSKTTTILGLHLILFTLAFSIVSVATLNVWVLIAPGGVVLAAVVMGMRSLRPQQMRQFVSPALLIECYREHDYFDHEIAWSLVEAMVESEDIYGEKIADKARWLFRLQASSAILVAAFTISALVEALI